LKNRNQFIGFLFYLKVICLKLIVSDLDGTLLNSKHKVSAENAAALQEAQRRGVEIAIATGRTYKNALAICRSAGLKAHIISNHGAFVYDKEGKRLKAEGLKREHVTHALKWLADKNYFYNVCSDKQVFIPRNAEELLDADFKTAKLRIAQITPERVQDVIQIYRRMEGVTRIDGVEELLAAQHTFGSIVAITFDRDKLKQGREYFDQYEGLAMMVAGRDIFEMIHVEASKGNALECLTANLNISLQEVMAIGDNYNDISMLEKVGYSVAIGNAEEDVKKVCTQVSLSNDMHGVAYAVNRMLAG
jgi:Cof subfamily protein (haloacid dehalogenase superfamily)